MALHNEAGEEQSFQLNVRRPKRSTQEQQIWTKIYEFIESKISRKNGNE